MVHCTRLCNPSLNLKFSDRGIIIVGTTALCLPDTTDLTSVDGDNIIFTSPLVVVIGWLPMTTHVSHYL